MLAFDIETTGLDPKTDEVTVVCMYGEVGGAHIERVFNFARDGPAQHAKACKEMLNSAEVLCAMNGFRFDVPFLATYLGVADEDAAGWMLKLHDPCEVSGCLFVCFFFVAYWCELGDTEY